MPPFIRGLFVQEIYRIRAFQGHSRVPRRQGCQSGATPWRGSDRTAPEDSRNPAPRNDLLAYLGQAGGAQLRVERPQAGGPEAFPAPERRLELRLLLRDGGDRLGGGLDVGSLDDAVEGAELSIEPGERRVAAASAGLDRGERAVEL